MKIYADRLLAETVPDGTFGGARPRRGQVREQPRISTSEGRRRLAALTAEIAAASAARRATPTTT
ncbi:hypothetical protein AB0420_02235 [Streptomyces caelestis]|uniref:hypothetical protein n=1 Tax=Streptomyces caelestis TaxID=36816 RepID=UPI00344DCC02